MLECEGEHPGLERISAVNDRDRPVKRRKTSGEIMLLEVVEIGDPNSSCRASYDESSFTSHQSLLQASTSTEPLVHGTCHLSKGSSVSIQNHEVKSPKAVSVSAKNEVNGKGTIHRDTCQYSLATEVLTASPKKDDRIFEVVKKIAQHVLSLSTSRIYLPMITQCPTSPSFLPSSIAFTEIPAASFVKAPYLTTSR